MKEEDISALIKHRLDQAETALDDGKFLLDGGRSPQSVINRAYYAMFYAVLALLQKIGRTPSKHTGAISIFDTEFVIKGIFRKELSRNLHKGFELRQVMDYKTGMVISRDKAEEMLDKAVQFVAAVKKYLEDITR